jgi:hypothetical protein
VETPAAPPPLPSRAKRVALMVLIGSGLGSLCAFCPPVYQAPCHYAARIIGFLLGSP